jgi:hypothetical protein
MAFGLAAASRVDGIGWSDLVLQDDNPARQQAHLVDPITAHTTLVSSLKNREVGPFMLITCRRSHSSPRPRPFRIRWVARFSSLKSHLPSDVLGVVPRRSSAGYDRGWNGAVCGYRPGSRDLGTVLLEDARRSSIRAEVRSATSSDDIVPNTTVS